MSDIAIVSAFCISLFSAMMVITALFEDNLVEIEVEEEDEGGYPLSATERIKK